MPLNLDDLIARIDKLPPDKLKSLIEARKKDGRLWLPNPGWQTTALHCKADELLFAGEPGGGKLLDLDTPIPTPRGWLTMRQLRVGSTVYDEMGRETRVVAFSDVVFDEPAYRLRFDDGEEIVAGASHLWFTETRKDRMGQLKFTDEWRAHRKSKRGRVENPTKLWLVAMNEASERVKSVPSFGSVKTTKEIAETLRRGDGGVNHAVPLAKPLDCARRPLRIPPYTFGAWLGDGTSAAADITSMDPEIIQEIGKDGFVLTKKSKSGIGKASTYSIRRMGQQVQYAGFGQRTSPESLTTDLRTLGVLGNKHIPVEYLRSHVEDRTLLVQGLMDTDGTVDERGKCEFTSANRQLANDVCELLVSLGQKVRVTEGRAMLKGKDCGPKYRLIWRPTFQVFRLPRKAARLTKLDRRKTRSVRYIVAADPVPCRPMKCIEVENKSHLYLCGRAMVPTHNSALMIGAAITEHTNSIIFRREYPQIKGLEDETERILGTRKGYNHQTKVWRLPGAKRRVLEFGSAPHEKDVSRYQGRAHDFKGFDEITHFSRAQYRYLTLWLRSTRPGQRCRIIAAGNPPTRPEGFWVVEHWKPWLDDRYHDPADPGELRWAVPRDDDSDEELFFRSVEEAVEHVKTLAKPPTDPTTGEILPPRSRSFVPSELSQNPDLAKTGYGAVLGYADKSMRSMASGEFKSALPDDPWQIIPTEWIIAAEERWEASPPNDVPMTALGVDVAQGGEDETVLAPRHDWWFAPLVTVPGSKTPMPSDTAALVVKHRRDMAAVIVDCGGGYGGGVVDWLRQNNSIMAIPHKGSNAAMGRSKCRQHAFLNKRAEVWWRMREALDPDQPGGSPIALPRDHGLRADLAAPRYSIEPRGVQVESKEEIKKRIGRSPDKGDAVVMAWGEGQIALKRGMVGPSAASGGRERPKFANVAYASSKRAHGRRM